MYVIYNIALTNAYYQECFLPIVDFEGTDERICRFRFQKKKIFLGIRWWEFDDDGMSFMQFSNAELMMKNREKAVRTLEEIRLEQKKTRRNDKKSWFSPRLFAESADLRAIRIKRITCTPASFFRIQYQLLSAHLNLLPFPFLS